MKLTYALCLALVTAPFISTPIWATPKPKVVPEETTVAASSLNAQPSVAWIDVKAKGFDSVRLVQGVDLKRFKTFQVEQPTLEFDKQWLWDFKSQMTERDEERIRKSYTDALRKALEDALSKDLGLEQTHSPDSDTLIVSANLSRFRLLAPDLSMRPISKDFVQYTGAARLELSLNDSGNQPLVQLSDYSETSQFSGPGDLKRTNRVENLRDFKALSKRWAGRLTDYLSTLRS
ncbi:DUF3313 family protein [Saccharophagus sp. K07]|uniref:DUF3313 family protein n=1 Tax=Saccharophagus sp. K07 TaxID=2283636 RepID=UPI001651DF9F|nr:DUF3313 family protein [Saccharophagus sp. K07]MBC6904648.1 DUF3313 family protein [Saccharophagus sp. K07]